MSSCLSAILLVLLAAVGISSWRMRIADGKAHRQAGRQVGVRAGEQASRQAGGRAGKQVGEHLCVHLCFWIKTRELR